MPSPTPPALRARIMDAYNQGQTSSRALALRFAISQPTVSRLIRRFKVTQSCDPKPHGGGRTPSISKKGQAKLERMVRSNAKLTAKEIAIALSSKGTNSPSQWAVWRLLKKLKFSRKKATFQADERERSDVKRKRKRFCKAAKKVDPARLVFLDETGVNSSMTQSTAWAPVGERAHQSKACSPRNNVTVLGAMRSTGPVAMRSLDGGMKKKNFISFVVDVLCPRLKAGDILVMDNLASHHAIEVVEAVSSRNASVTFLPPYSPDLNPIEMLWNSLKGRFRKRFRRTVQKVKRAIGGCWRSLENLDLESFLPPCGYLSPIQCNR